MYHQELLAWELEVLTVVVFLLLFQSHCWFVFQWLFHELVVLVAQDNMLAVLNKTQNSVSGLIKYTLFLQILDALDADMKVIV